MNRAAWPAPDEHYDPTTQLFWEIPNLMHPYVDCALFRLTQPPISSSECANINDPSNPFNIFIDIL
jgi:hypothetical protein